MSLPLRRSSTSIRCSCHHNDHSIIGWSEGYASGRRLLQQLVSGADIDSTTANRVFPGRPGIPLNNEIQLVQKALEEAHLHGARSIQGDPVLQDGSCSLLEFGRCRLYLGGVGVGSDTNKNISNSICTVRPEWETLLKDTFQAVVESMQLYGFATQLSRHDLFHGHLF